MSMPTSRGAKILGSFMIVAAILCILNEAFPLIWRLPAAGALAGAGLACVFIRPRLKAMLPLAMVLGAVGYVVAISMAKGTA